MNDHRALQRTLFRMQIDSAFAARVFAREAEALASTGLGEADLERLLAADPRAVAADAGGRRAARLVGNVSLEFLRTVHLAGARLGCDGFAMAFAGSGELHDALRSDRPLPLAFGAYAARVLAPVLDATTAGLLELERAFARARRAPREDAPSASELAGDDPVALAPTAWLVDVPSGTLAFAAELTAASERMPTAPSAGELDGTARETLLVTAKGAGWPRDAEVELLGEAAAAVARAAVPGLDRGGRAALAREWGAEPAELEGFVKGLLDDGVLIRGS